MATKIWRGDALAVAQIDTLTPANVAVDDVFTATINGKSISFTATAATVANVVTGIVAAWNATEIPEFAEVTATDSTTHVTLTADTAGKPFTVTASATQGGGADDQTFTQATTTANAGPNVYAAANFRDASDNSMGLPGAGDTLIIKDTDVSILYSMDRSGDGTLTEIQIDADFTGEIGLPRLNQDHDGGAEHDYDEYRYTFLNIKATTVYIGAGSGSGSPRLKIENPENASITWVYSSGSSPDEAHPIQLEGASALLYVTGGNVDLGRDFNQSAAYAIVKISGGRLRTHKDRASIATLKASGNADCDLADTATSVTIT